MGRSVALAALRVDGFYPYRRDRSHFCGVG